MEQNRYHCEKCMGFMDLVSSGKDTKGNFVELYKCRECGHEDYLNKPEKRKGVSGLEKKTERKI